MTLFHLIKLIWIILWLQIAESKHKIHLVTTSMTYKNMWYTRTLPQRLWLLHQRRNINWTTFQAATTATKATSVWVNCIKTNKWRSKCTHKMMRRAAVSIMGLNLPTIMKITIRSDKFMIPGIRIKMPWKKRINFFWLCPRLIITSLLHQCRDLITWDKKVTWAIHTRIKFIRRRKLILNIQRNLNTSR